MLPWLICTRLLPRPPQRGVSSHCATLYVTDCVLHILALWYTPNSLFHHPHHSLKECTSATISHGTRGLLPTFGS